MSDNSNPTSQTLVTEDKMTMSQSTNLAINAINSNQNSVTDGDDDQGDDQNDDHPNASNGNENGGDETILNHLPAVDSLPATSEYEVNTFQTLAAKKPIKDALLIMMKIGDTSLVGGLESALCMDMNGDIAHVVDPDDNGIMRKLQCGEAFGVDYIGQCHRTQKSLGTIQFEVTFNSETEFKMRLAALSPATDVRYSKLVDLSKLTSGTHANFIGWFAPSMMVIDKRTSSGETEHLKVGALFFDDSTRTCVMFDGWYEECKHIRSLVLINQEHPVPVAIIGIQIKDDKYLQQRILHADKYTTYAFPSNTPNALVEWPPKLPNSLTLSQWSIPDISKDAASTTIVTLRKRVNKELYDAEHGDNLTKVVRNVRLRWRSCNSTMASCGSFCVECNSEFTSHILTS